MPLLNRTPRNNAYAFLHISAPCHCSDQLFLAAAILSRAVPLRYNALLCQRNSSRCFALTKLYSSQPLLFVARLRLCYAFRCCAFAAPGLAIPLLLNAHLCRCVLPKRCHYLRPSAACVPDRQQFNSLPIDVSDLCGPVFLPCLCAAQRALLRHMIPYHLCADPEYHAYASAPIPSLPIDHGRTYFRKSLNLRLHARIPTGRTALPN